jgi:hypothetical protein
MSVNVWEQRADEGRKAFAAFLVFLEDGAERSCANVARTLHVSKTLISHWSSKFDWQERSRAYDLMLDERRFARNIAEAVEMAERHAAIARLVLSKCHDAAKKLDPAKIRSGALARLLGEASRMEFRARGEPDDERVASVTINVRRAEGSIVPNKGGVSQHERPSGSSTARSSRDRRAAHPSA